MIELVRDRDIPVIMGNYDDGIGFSRGDCGCAYKNPEEKANGELSIAWTDDTVTPENKQWLQTLLPEFRIETGGVRVRVVHGSLRRINEYLFQDRDENSLKRIAASADCDVLVFGHTHVPWTREISGVTFVNAGSAGKPKDGVPRACWVLLDISESGVVNVGYHRVDYDIAVETSAIRAAERLPDANARALETGGKP